MNEITIIHRVNISSKAIAITFDDGPNPKYTPELLALFAEVNGKATFFMIGEQIKANPELAVAVHEQGHEIGNHTYTHPYLTQVDSAQCLDELQRTDQLIQEITGKKPQTFRPPFFDYNDKVNDIIKSFNYSMIGATNMETRDWEQPQPGVEHIINKTIDNTQNGSVLLFHDGYGDRSQTIEAISILLPKLAAEGYQFVTVSELLQLT